MTWALYLGSCAALMVATLIGGGTPAGALAILGAYLLVASFVVAVKRHG